MNNQVAKPFRMVLNTQTIKELVSELASEGVRPAHFKVETKEIIDENNAVVERMKDHNKRTLDKIKSVDLNEERYDAG